MRAGRAALWARTQERGTYFGLRSMLICYQILGKNVFRFALVFVALYFFIFDRSARRSSRDFLNRVYRHNKNGPSPSQPPRWHQSFHHIYNFGEAVLDKTAAWAGDLENVKVKYIRRELLEDWHQSGRGCVLLSSHLGNVEVCRALVSKRSTMRFNVLVHTHNAEKFNRLLKKINPGAGVNLIEVNSLTPVFGAMLQHRLDRGEFIVIAGDRSPVNGGRMNGGRTRAVSFFGQMAEFPVGGALLAAVLRCPVGMVTAVKDKDGYLLRVDALGDFTHVARKDRDQVAGAIMDEYAKNLEHIASAYPYQWFNFFDFWLVEETYELPVGA